MNWPVGKVEQLLKIKALQRQLEEVQSGRRSVVLHSYHSPVRSDWELAYQQQRSGTLPIPPGTKLCWYDMRSGWMRTYTTAWDRENGTATSGEIYPYSQNQNSDYFRFIGNLDVAGYIRGAENNTPNLHFGLDIGKRIRQRLLSLEIYFRISMPTAAVANYLYLNYGNLVTQVDVSGVIYRQVSGGFLQGTGATVAASTSSSQNALNRLADYNAKPAAGAYQDEMTVGYCRILNPFGGRLESGVPDGFAQTSFLGYLLSPVAQVAGVDTLQFRQFSGVKLTNLNIDQYYRLFTTTDNTGADDNLVRKGRGWVYGYFDEAIGSLEEYE